MKRAALALAALAVSTGCAVTPDLRPTANTAPFPTGLVPSALDGMVAQPESSAQAAFRAVGDNSAVAHGEVWTLREDGVVVGSVQVSQLKGGLTTRAARVRAGIRAAVNDIPFRWFKVADRQWVGVQTSPQVSIYLWMPPRRDVYVILQLKSTVADPDRIATDLIAYQEKTP